MTRKRRSHTRSPGIQGRSLVANAARPKRCWSPLRWALLGALAGIQLLSPAVSAQRTDAPPAYSYQGSKLLLLVQSPAAERTVMRWRALSMAGSPVGALRQMPVDLRPGENRVELLVGDAGGHQLSYRVRGRTTHIWANRGIWYLGDSELRVDKTLHTRSLSSDPAVSGDRLLAGGLRAYVRSEDGRTPLELGRTLCYDADRGVSLGALDALALVAGGTAGPVRLTVAQVISKEETQYWDYILVLDKELRRYEIPLALFRPRMPQNRRLLTIFSLSLRTTTPARQGTYLEIDALALNRSGRRVRSVSRRARTVKVSLHPGRRQAEATLWLADLQGRRQQRPLRGLTAVSESEAQRFWICYAAADGGRGCDPPDAPQTAYALPPAKGEPQIIDRFEFRAPINFARQPTLTFASSVKLQQQMVAEQRAGSLLLRYQPEEAGDYVGYLTPLPGDLPGDLRAVELTFRGEISPAAVSVGLRDAAGHEPRVVLQAYCSQQQESWQTARIPFAAFAAVLAGAGGRPRRLQEPVSLAVTMGISTTPAAYALELKQIRLIPDLVPLTVARFDEGLDFQTALGASITLESRRGVKLEVTPQAPGRFGRALSISVTAEQTNGYGLVSLGLGRLDLQGYRKLTFWLRGGSSPTRALLHLADGKRVAKLALADQARASADWQKVQIDMDDFVGPIDRSQLKQLILVWEDQAIYKETLVLDEIVFE